MTAIIKKVANAEKLSKIFDLLVPDSGDRVILFSQYSGRLFLTTEYSDRKYYVVETNGGMFFVAEHIKTYRNFLEFYNANMERIGRIDCDRYSLLEVDIGGKDVTEEWE